MFFVKISLCLLCTVKMGHSFEVLFNQNYDNLYEYQIINTDQKQSQKNTDKTIKIHFGFLGNDNYERRKIYLDNCFSNRCASFGINFRINFSLGNNDDI